MVRQWVELQINISVTEPIEVPPNPIPSHVVLEPVKVMVTIVASVSIFIVRFAVNETTPVVNCALATIPNPSANNVSNFFFIILVFNWLIFILID